MVMKYVGSKAKLSKDIAPIINKIIKENDIKIFEDWFVGGANLIDKINCDVKIGYDINDYLIEMWNCLQRGYKIPTEISKEEYLKVKNNIGSYPKEYVAIVGFCATYNAGWFRRYGGVATTKSGKIRNYYDEAKRNIEKQVPNILDVKFLCKDYKDIIPQKNSLIYCDKPYENSNCEMYQNKFNHDEFWEKIRIISKDNIVLISEYSAPKDFECIFEKQTNVYFDNKQTKKSTEKLFRLKR